jgi:CRISPR-associated protein Cas1
MKQLLNTLFVTTPGTYVHIDHDTVKLEKEGSILAQLPILHFASIVCVGEVMMSPAAMMRFSSEGRTITFLDRIGRFAARVEGPVSGNVLLRKAQYETLSKSDSCLQMARQFVAGKIVNCRTILLRTSRDALDANDKEQLQRAIASLKGNVERIASAEDLDTIRGIEGDAARTYFAVFDRMIKTDRDNFHLQERTRRPPRDRMNALLSFLYTMLVHDYISAAEGVGLDPQVGFLHSLRPGRPALALDLMEEMRPLLPDRLAVSLVNLKQITTDDFETRHGGAVLLNDKGRKKVIIAYQQRKQEEMSHLLLKEEIPFGLVPHIQARLLARLLRGDIGEYVPYTVK